MALEKSMFFDSVGDDRVYQAEEYASYFRTFLTDGIFNGGDNLKVTAQGTGMQVEVDYGMAMIQGYAYWLENDGQGDHIVQIPASDTASRLDRIILRLNRSLSERTIKIYVKKGTPAYSPEPPALERTGNIFELSLARVRVPPNTLKIVSTDIVDERRNPEVCGMINSLITLDPSDFDQQAQDILFLLKNQGYLPLTGGIMQADIDFDNHTAVNVKDPVNDQDAANKRYTDQEINVQKVRLDQQNREILADHNLITIEHNLNKYPVIQAMYWEYGIDTVPIDEPPADIPWDGTEPIKIAVDATFLSRQSIEIRVPSNYMLANPEVSSADNQILLVSGHRSIGITLS